ncbi:uncharacterized protein LOC115466989 [Microcaecilia unicolor]|uniref:Uncharacterized protein LOC115466989 n=1 Tax=Microcaecilia unicolor TaxID=1415580 RepID=A0A6P7XMX1_9AMPH|nr:uncharacterized protein LOC115466989 [Microcaecilia unicolor]XP_030054461.1 uncharacterized protein LOC115466989 [Microcaecilia unicolor]XP_030054462.1 uncharacterized protein LOC115466989 [Microcaecilia unicolor]XP_030054463.1 uncharacterized protein LOC115466989 [Microcaecilia unicolor]XP_030054464.1 uncharacterized protein LOC115466989 [Microcaecilia unicolor]XP_030054466.1 uncharacterized protein LOC115466989 [Microcaecilia unicolor]XP_030054467.1 uncharacterized protein LOC115466989 [
MEHLLQGCRGSEVKSFGILDKSVSQWTVEDVCEWLRHGCLEERSFLLEAVTYHAISGRVLLRLTDMSLMRMGLCQQSQRHEVLQAVQELRLQKELEDLIDISGDGTTMTATEFEQVYDTDANSVFSPNLEHINKEITVAERTPKEEKCHAYVQTSPTQSPSFLERPRFQAQQHQVAITDDSYLSINSNLRAVRGSLAGMHKDISNMTKAMYVLAKSINKLAKSNVTLNAELVCTNQAIGETMQRLSGVLDALGELTGCRTMRTDRIIQESTGSSPTGNPQTPESLPEIAFNARFPQRRQRRGLKRAKSKQN